MINYRLPNKDINENITTVRKQQELLNNDRYEKSDITKKDNVNEYTNESTISSYKPSDIFDETGTMDYHGYKKNKGLKIVKDDFEELYKQENEVAITNDGNEQFDSYNIEQRKKNQVIKVPINDIMSYISLKDKGILLSISKNLAKGDYEKFQEYLSYKNQKIGVRRALEIIEEKLTEKEINEIKAIFSRYIDMNTVEEEK
ncbi:MAG: hypothetical protein RR262_11900 [Clostridium sp.]